MLENQHSPESLAIAFLRYFSYRLRAKGNKLTSVSLKTLQYLGKCSYISRIFKTVTLKSNNCIPIWVVGKNIPNYYNLKFN